jgi:hypothetical protein
MTILNRRRPSAWLLVALPSFILLRLCEHSLQETLHPTDSSTEDKKCLKRCPRCCWPPK